MFTDVADFNDFCSIFRIVSRAVARSQARDISDSANDRMDNFIDVFVHRRRSLVSFSFH